MRSLTLTDNLQDWAAAPQAFIFHAPLSRCQLYPNSEWGVELSWPGRPDRDCKPATCYLLWRRIMSGPPIEAVSAFIPHLFHPSSLHNSTHNAAPRRTADSVQLLPPLPPPAPANTSALPFLFDTASMPTRKTACSHCPAWEPEPMPPCCGVCIFARRRCTDFYPRQALSDTVARDLLDTGFPLQVGAGQPHIKPQYVQPSAPWPVDACRTSRHASCSNASAAARCGSWATARCFSSIMRQSASCGSLRPRCAARETGQGPATSPSPHSLPAHVRRPPGCT